jgi:hypothetical protein
MQQDFIVKNGTLVFQKGTVESFLSLAGIEDLTHPFSRFRDAEVGPQEPEQLEWAEFQFRMSSLEHASGLIEQLGFRPATLWPLLVLLRAVPVGDLDYRVATTAVCPYLKLGSFCVRDTEEERRLQPAILKGQSGLGLRLLGVRSHP